MGHTLVTMGVGQFPLWHRVPALLSGKTVKHTAYMGETGEQDGESENLITSELYLFSVTTFCFSSFCDLVL